MGDVVLVFNFLECHMTAWARKYDTTFAVADTGIDHLGMAKGRTLQDAYRAHRRPLLATPWPSHGSLILKIGLTYDLDRKLLDDENVWRYAVVQTEILTRPWLHLELFVIVLIVIEIEAGGDGITLADSTEWWRSQSERLVVFRVSEL